MGRRKPAPLTRQSADNCCESLIVERLFFFLFLFCSSYFSHTYVCLKLIMATSMCSFVIRGTVRDPATFKQPSWLSEVISVSGSRRIESPSQFIAICIFKTKCMILFSPRHTHTYPYTPTHAHILTHTPTTHTLPPLLRAVQCEGGPAEHADGVGHCHLRHLLAWGPDWRSDVGCLKWVLAAFLSQRTLPFATENCNRCKTTSFRWPQFSILVQPVWLIYCLQGATRLFQSSCIKYNEITHEHTRACFCTNTLLHIQLHSYMHTLAAIVIKHHHTQSDASRVAGAADKEGLHLYLQPLDMGPHTAHRSGLSVCNGEY